jgi:predicted transcriptional regulator YdeE
MPILKSRGFPDLDLINLKGAEPMNYKIVEKESFKVVGVKREFSCVNGENMVEIPKMWNDVHIDGTNDLLFKLNNGGLKGVLGVCVDKRDSGALLMDYWIAANHVGETPEGLLELEQHQNGEYLKYTVLCQMPCTRLGRKYSPNGFHPINMSMLGHLT